MVNMIKIPYHKNNINNTNEQYRVWSWIKIKAMVIIPDDGLFS